MGMNVGESGDYASEMEVYVKHGVPPLEVLQWATRNGAQAMGRHGVDLGEIAEGKLADLVVLDRDFFTVPDDQLCKVESLMTIVDGEITYARGPFEEHDGERRSPCDLIGDRTPDYPGPNDNNISSINHADNLPAGHR